MVGLAAPEAILDGTPCLGDVCREIRIRYQAVCDGYAVIGVISVYNSVAEYAAVSLSADTSEVSVVIGGRSADKSDVNVSLSCRESPDSAAVGSHDRQAFQLSF